MPFVRQYTQSNGGDQLGHNIMFASSRKRRVGTWSTSELAASTFATCRMISQAGISLWAKRQLRHPRPLISAALLPA